MAEMRKHQRFCSISCTQYWRWHNRTPDQRHAIGLKAGQASGVVQRRNREARIQAQIGSLDPLAAYRKGYAAGYSAGWYRGARDVPSQMGYPRAVNQ